MCVCVGCGWQLGLISCTFRQTNVVWVLYAYAASQLMFLRFRRAVPGAKKLHDPPALSATPCAFPMLRG
jgi:alpha-1,2-glucosyltransferase